MANFKFMICLLLALNFSLAKAEEIIQIPDTPNTIPDPLLSYSTVPTSYFTFNPSVLISKRRQEVIDSNQNKTPYLFSVKYLIDPRSPKTRRIGWFSCLENKLRIQFKITGSQTVTQLYDQPCADSKILNSHITTSVNSKLRYSKDFSGLSEFDRRDLQLIKELNDTFLKTPSDYGNFSLQHGYKTKKVFVFVHGFMKNSEYFRHSAEAAFYEGHNVLVGNLPGHENQMVGSENYVAQWLNYIECLTILARQYGDEVVLVGHSLGGNLVLHAAEENLVNKIILVQPLIKISQVSKFGYNLMRFLAPDRLHLLDVLASKGFREGSQAHELVNIVEEALKLEKVPFKGFSPDLKVLAYLSRVDLVVSTFKALDFLKSQIPQAVIRLHYSDHMTEPDIGFWNDIKVQEFIHATDFKNSESILY